jgi:hypothetical protein
MTAVELAGACPGDPRLEWYGGDHAMRSRRARADRLAFVREALGLG